MKIRVMSLCAVALLITACAGAPTRTLSGVSPKYASLPNGNDPMDPTQPSAAYREMAGAQSGENAVRRLERIKGRPLNLLSLSGGGQNGAFGAGFLLGWRERGDRPLFDAVGGVSTGALMATHALLGTEADDAVLEKLYTQITKDDIYSERSVFDLISGADSLCDTTPLQRMLEEVITEDTLTRVAAAHDEGRFLFVGTTNVDYDQTWVWNMSKIAKAGEIELYRKVLLASASFPIVFPPVEIDGHLFVDGAARSNLVVPGLAGSERPGPPLHGPGNLYLIDNGKLETPPAALRRALGDVAATTIGVMMNQSMQTAMTRTYVGSRILGYNFNYVGIATHVEIGKDPLAFDPNQMRAAFDAGRALARDPSPWLTDAPKSDDLPSWASEIISNPK